MGVSETIVAKNVGRWYTKKAKTKDFTFHLTPAAKLHQHKVVISKLNVCHIEHKRYATAMTEPVQFQDTPVTCN